MKCVLLMVALLLRMVPVIAQTLPVDSLLVQQEKLKWEALSKGEFGKHADWLAADFFNIGYLPDGTVNRFQKGGKVANPGMVPSGKMDLPPASFTTYDFHVLSAGRDAKIVTYIANGPLNLYVSSTWVKQGQGWKTLFYQATAYKPAK